MKVVLGIDPGTRQTGYGIVKLDGTKLSYIHSGTIMLDDGVPLNTRLNVIFETLSHLVKTYTPTDLAVESVFYSKNIQSTVSLAHARSVALVVSAQHNLSLGEYSPLEVKRAVVGYGQATKQQVSKMMERLFPEFKNQTSLDQSDALSIAVCHANSTRHTQKIRKALEPKVPLGVKLK